MAAPEPVAPAPASRGQRLVVAALAVAVLLVALATAEALFPFGSLNRDESTYVEFGELLAEGRLTLDAETHRAFRPWASGVLDGTIVMKYTPPWPAVLGAFGLLGEGGRRAAPAVVGAIVVVLVHVLARRMAPGDRRSAAVLAAGAAAASPLLVIQSATYLSYVFQLALGLGAAVLLLRRDDAGAAAAGFLAALAAFARPFDALLFIGPFACVVLWRQRRLLVAFLLGALPVGAAMLAYNAAVVGHPLRLAFTVTGPSDTFGFGRRGVFPSSTIAFGPLDGVVATVLSGGWILAWVFGGPLLAVAAVVGYRRLPPSGARRALGLVTVLYPLGYLFFWGAHAVVSEWSGAATLGPFYHLPLLVPLAVFGGYGAAGMASRRGLAGLIALAVLATAAALPPKVRANQEVTDVYAAAAKAAATVTGPAVLLAPNRGVTGFDSWTPSLRNRPDLVQPVLYADDRGARDFDLVDAHPQRRLVRLVPRPTTSAPTGFRTEDVAAVRGTSSVRLEADLRLPRGARQARPYLVVGRREVSQPATAGGAVAWTLTPASAGPPAGPGLDLVDERGVLAVGVHVTEGEGLRRRYEQRIAYRVRGEEVELLVPGRGFHRLARRWVPADVRSVVEVRGVAAPSGQGT